MTYGAAPQGAARTFTRYVALGDSQTEGLGDGDDIRGYRGWADRLAEHLAEADPDLLYANLAVRGRLAAQVHAEQLGPALRLRPDLVTVMAGMNDLVRPGFDATEIAAVWRRCSPRSPRPAPTWSP
ncbi:SGNH/GDSL hydrolase family protein [Streptosporangium lutulentum]